MRSFTWTSWHAIPTPFARTVFRTTFFCESSWLTASCFEVSWGVSFYKAERFILHQQMVVGVFLKVSRAFV